MFTWYVKVLRQYADFRGRARRTEFWMFMLVNFIVYLLFLIYLAYNLANGLVVGTAATIANYAYNAYFLAILIPMLAVGARRLHDIGKSGWLQLVMYVPLSIIMLISLPISNAVKQGSEPNMTMIVVLGMLALIILPIGIWFLIMGCTDSQPGTNKWGNNPKEDSLAEQFDQL